MNKTTKRLLAAAAVIAISGAFAAVNAEYDPNRTNEIPVISTKSVETVNTIRVNGLPIVNQKIADGDTVMIPLREVAERLGYTVVWNESDSSIDVSRGDYTLRLKIDENTMCKEEDMIVTLDKKPMLVDDSITYVPLSFIGDAIDGRTSVLGDGSVEIIELREVAVTEILEDNAFMVNDSMIGEVMVRISDETTITKNGETADFQDIAKDMTINILYSPAMTMSLPPQTTAVIIEIPADNSEKEDTLEDTLIEAGVEFAGVIKEIDEEGMVIVDVDNSDMDVALIVNDDTVISHVKNKRIYKAEDLEKGMKISGKHSQMMTKSIPPQTAAIEIIIAE